MGKKRVAEESKEELLKVSKDVDDGILRASKKAKKMKTLMGGSIHIRVSYNNVMITITTKGGDVLSWATSGSVGFKGPRKSTPYAASKVVEAVFERLGNVTMDDANIYIRGMGGGRDGALRSIVGRGISIASIQDVTPIPHGGPRPRKARRV